MQFQVPQFIDIAPKIVGPLTLRQFLYIAGATLPAFLLFFVLQFFLWLLVTGILVGGAVTLAFGKVNGQPIERVMLAAFQYFWNPRIYLWRRVEEKTKLPVLHAPSKKPTINLRELAVGLKKPFSHPSAKLRPSAVHVKKPLFSPPAKTHHAPALERERMPLKDLSLKIATTVRPIEKREKSVRLFGFLEREKEFFEEFRKTTGEREEARRIDYR